MLILLLRYYLVAAAACLKCIKNWTKLSIGFTRRLAKYKQKIKINLWKNK